MTNAIRFPTFKFVCSLFSVSETVHKTLFVAPCEFVKETRASRVREGQHLEDG